VSKGNKATCNGLSAYLELPLFTEAMGSFTKLENGCLRKFSDWVHTKRMPSWS